MQAILCIVSFLFGGLSMVAAASQMKSDKKSIPALIMIAGSLLLISAVICNVLGQQFDWIAALLGCTAICVAAISNGIKSKQLHVQHHIIRIALSVMLFIGFVIL